MKPMQFFKGLFYDKLLLETGGWPFFLEFIGSSS